MISPTIWLILGVVFIVIEVAALPGVGFLFAGLAAILLGGLISADFLAVTTLANQIVYFFFLTLVWGIILWKPLKKVTKAKAGQAYKNLSDATGVVDDERDLTVGKVGFVKWSGTKMRARIRPDSETQRIVNGETVWVHDQKDGILLVDTTKPEHK